MLVRPCLLPSNHTALSLQSTHSTDLKAVQAAARISLCPLGGRPPVPCTCRAALPALFRQRDAFKLLQPGGFLDSDGSAAEQGGEDLPPAVPRLRENLEAFLADKLELVDRWGDPLPPAWVGRRQHVNSLIFRSWSTGCSRWTEGPL